MTDLSTIKEAAQISNDKDGSPMVTIPLNLWEEILTQIETQLVKIQPDTEPTYDPATDFLLVLAQAAEENDLRSGRNDISENFDDIVGQVIAEDFIKRRAENDAKE